MRATEQKKKRKKEGNEGLGHFFISDGRGQMGPSVRLRAISLIEQKKEGHYCTFATVREGDREILRKLLRTTHVFECVQLSNFVPSSFLRIYLHVESAVHSFV